MLYGHGKTDPSWETGWIELMEWAMLALWNAAQRDGGVQVRRAVLTAWISLYLSQLEAYYTRNAALLMSDDSLACGHHGEFSQAISSHHAFWHMGRLGILGASFLEMNSSMSKDVADSELFMDGHTKVMNCLVGMINANPACRRPMLDIHHIELFLLWVLFAAANRSEEVLSVFVEIHERLFLRRCGHGGVRLIDQSNSWPLLLEHVASGERPSESFGKSSYLLQMLIELCACKLGPQGEELAWAYYQHLILGAADEGESLEFAEKVELQSWVPPDDWLNKVLAGPIGHEGICVTINLGGLKPPSRERFASEVRAFVDTMRKAHPQKELNGVPFGAAVLACIMHRSPLPPIFWRSALESATTDKKKITTQSAKRREKK